MALFTLFLFLHRYINIISLVIDKGTRWIRGRRWASRPPASSSFTWPRRRPAAPFGCASKSWASKLTCVTSTCTRGPSTLNRGSSKWVWWEFLVKLSGMQSFLFCIYTDESAAHGADDQRRRIHPVGEVEDAEFFFLFAFDLWRLYDCILTIPPPPFLAVCLVYLQSHTKLDRFRSFWGSAHVKRPAIWCRKSWWSS